MQNPLITDAAGLAPYLRNVKRWGHNGYDWSADPPCHASSSGAASSFHFGDAAGGGVKVGCWAGCQGPGFVKRIEYALGIRLQINVDGKLTHQSSFPGMAPSVRQPRPVAPKPPVLDYKILPATPAAGPVTLEDWFAAPVWFVGAGNRGSGKHAATWQHNGQTWTCRHSKQPEDGGLQLARFGGRLPEGQQIQPWASLRDHRGPDCRDPGAPGDGTPPLRFLRRRRRYTQPLAGWLHRRRFQAGPGPRRHRRSLHGPRPASTD